MVCFFLQLMDVPSCPRNMKLLASLLVLFLSSPIHASCELNKAFFTHMENVTSFPRVSELKELVYYKGYVSTANAIAEEDVKNKALYHEEHIRLMAEQYLLLSAWIDNRIVKVTKSLEICSGDDGELVIMARLVGGEVIAKVIPFKKVGGKWLRSFAITSGYSYIEEDDAESLLKNM
jgi:predicted GIY-YIG superfamily endonuclease